jgi:hypothetical protein
MALLYPPVRRWRGYLGEFGRGRLDRWQYADGWTAGMIAETV